MSDMSKASRLTKDVERALAALLDIILAVSKERDDYENRLMELGAELAAEQKARAARAKSEAVASEMAKQERMIKDMLCDAGIGRAPVMDMVRACQWAIVEANEAHAKTMRERDDLRDELSEERRRHDAAHHSALSAQSWCGDLQDEIARLKAAHHAEQERVKAERDKALAELESVNAHLTASRAAHAEAEEYSARMSLEYEERLAAERLIMRKATKALEEALTIHDSKRAAAQQLAAELARLRGDVDKANARAERLGAAVVALCGEPDGKFDAFDLDLTEDSRDPNGVTVFGAPDSVHITAGEAYGDGPASITDPAQLAELISALQHALASMVSRGGEG
jgi:predicted  nucleic acid-binding Zn-ribbon protein